MAQVTGTGWLLSTAPAWAGDWFDREHLFPAGGKLDPAQFVATDAVVVTVGVAGAALNATSVPVAALAGPIPSGTTLSFGTNKFARLTSAAATGATSLAVAAIPTALVSGDTATYAGAGTLKKVVVSGTVVGRTYAERDAGTGFGPAISTDDEIYIVAFDVEDVDRNNDAALYRPGGIVKETYLPNWATLGTPLQTALRSRYQCVRGAN